MVCLTCFVPPTFSVFCKQEADESLNFEEQILEAAKSIAAATSALVKAASAAQRELVAQGKVSAPELSVRYWAYPGGNSLVEIM